MLTLALETSTRLGSIALGDGDRLISECALAVRATHSETVLDEVARMLARARVDPGGIERVVIGAGPGSFHRRAHRGRARQGLVSRPRGAAVRLLQPARRRRFRGTRARVRALRRPPGEVYGAAYARGGLEGPRFGPAASGIDAWLDRLHDVGGWAFAGEGAIRQRRAIEARGGVVLPAFLGVPRAAALLWLGERLPGGRVDDITRWEPGYVRSSGAERPRGARWRP